MNNTSQLTGVFGEIKVCTALDSLSQKYHLRYIHNFPIVTQDKHKQIDCVLICASGIYSIEVKNWSGSIYCDAESQYWLAEYPDRDVTVKSPLLQNRMHCSYLTPIVNFDAKNLVVFSNLANLVNKLSNTIYMSELEEYVVKSPTELSEQSIESLYKKLLAYKQKNEVNLLLDFFFKRVDGRAH